MPKLIDGDSGNRKLEPGEMRTYTGRTKSGIEKDVQLTRTARPYAEDLADAYNASLDPGAKARGVEWFVNPTTGEMQMGYKFDYSKFRPASN